MSEWIDRTRALAALGVKPQTLYAYVSRGRIAMRADPADSRRSLYRADDIAALTTRRARGRKPAAIAASAIAWGEPAIDTAISTVHHGRLIYRGRDAVALARAATLEEAAALLWGAAPIRFAVPEAVAGNPFRALAALVAASRPMPGLGEDRLWRDGEVAVGQIAAAFGAVAGAEPVHCRLGQAWSLDPAHTDSLRRALVLLADHELNASTFAARVAASTGAPMAACLLAGLCALSGPRHGGAGAALLALVAEALQSRPAAAVDAWLARGQPLPGFGHPLYPQGDPRAALLLEDLSVDPVMTEIREAAFAVTGALPNIDFALAAFTRAVQLPPTVPFAVFTVARSVGWVAHAIEQIGNGDLIRPRARYTGLTPAD